MDSEDEEEMRRYHRELFGDDSDDGGDGDTTTTTNQPVAAAATNGGRQSPTGSIHSDNDGGGQLNQNGDKDEEKGKKVKPKKQGPVNPVLLTADKLCGKDGLLKIEEIFKNFKFEGKGREKQDLDRLLHKLEHWAHILYPRHPFAQILERVEFLGIKKRSVKTYVTKLRMGLISNIDPEVDKLLELDEHNISSDEEQLVPREEVQSPSRPTETAVAAADDGIPSDDDFPMIDDAEIDALINPTQKSPVPARSNSPSPNSSPIQSQRRQKLRKDFESSDDEDPFSSNVNPSSSPPVASSTEFPLMEVEDMNDK